MDWVSDLKQLLGEGLYPHNLRRIMECCDRGLKENEQALAAFVIRGVVGELLREWEGQAVTVAETRRAERQLQPALEAVVTGLEQHQPAAALAPALEGLARAFATL
jgi:hypothetical protein